MTRSPARVAILAARGLRGLFLTAIAHRVRYFLRPSRCTQSRVVAPNRCFVQHGGSVARQSGDLQ